MAKEQYDLFEQPPPHLARAHSAEQVSSLPYRPPHDGHPIYLAAQELVHFMATLKFNDWQKSVLIPHLRNLVDKVRAAESDHVRWFELGYIVSAMEIEQLRSRAAAREICAKYGVKLP